MKRNKQKQKEQVKPLLPRFRVLMGKKKHLLTLSLVLSGLSAAMHAVPLIMVWMVARKLLQSPQALEISQVVPYALIAFGVEALAILSYFAALCCSHLAAFHVEVNMQKVGMGRLIHMPLGFFDQNESGRMRKIVNDGAGITHTFLAHQLPDLAASMISPLILLVMVFAVDWRLGLALMVPILLGFAVSSTMVSTAGQAFQQRYFDALEEMSSESVEYVRGIPVVKTFGQSIHAFKRFYGSIIRYKEMVYAYSIHWRAPWSFSYAIFQAGAFFLIPAAILMLSSGFDIAQVMPNYVFYLLISPMFTMLMMRSMYVRQNTNIARQAIDRMEALLEYPPLPQSGHSRKPGDHSLSFHNVTFAYPGTRQPAVSGISFEVKPGQTVALVGSSGGGKTTIARLAARFFDPQEGEVLIGGINVRDIPKEDLMREISFVFQNTRLLRVSLRDNIRYGNDGATETDIQRGVDLSQSRPIIEALPQGLDTVIGAKGTYLSGGEQQRIALARAIVKDAPIVLLDEATAFADPENEHLIHKALSALSQDKTTLLIAHRLTSVVHADNILVIDQGRIAEAGKHEELLKKKGLYQSMWEEYQTATQWKIRSGEKELVS